MAVWNTASRAASTACCPGDILLIGPMELHQPRIAKDHGPYERMVLWLDKRYLEQLSTPRRA